MTRYKEIAYRCGGALIKGYHDAPNSGFSCQIFVNGRMVAEKYTFLSKPNDREAVESAVRGAISHAVEDGDVNEYVFRVGNGGRWKIARAS